MISAPLDRLQLQSNGFAIIPDVLDPPTIEGLLDALATLRDEAEQRSRNNQVYAQRNLLKRMNESRELAQFPAVRSLIEQVLGSGARVVRGLLFDKTPGANWKVAWHQDLSIAVKQRMDVPGFGPWSMKAGTQHVQPPLHILENMLTIRLHLDDCFADNGALTVLPGSHRAGVLSPAQIAHWRQATLPTSCEVPRGGAVLMRPLLLHASSTAIRAGHRRVIHLEYAGADLPGGLQWDTEPPVL